MKTLETDGAAIGCNPIEVGSTLIGVSWKTVQPRLAGSSLHLLKQISSVLAKVLVGLGQCRRVLMTS